MGNGVWSAEMIRTAVASERPLVAGAPDLEEQVQPNGLDLTLARVSRLVGVGVLGADSADRHLPDAEVLEFDAGGWLDLKPGPYQVMLNEVVRLPLDVMALARPRSSLNRSGVTIHTAVWDAGYEGRSTALLSVLNPVGFRVQRNARVMQMVFISMAAATTAGYAGVYQGENLATL